MVDGLVVALLVACLVAALVLGVEGARGAQPLQWHLGVVAVYTTVFLALAIAGMRRAPDCMQKKAPFWIF